MRMHRLLHVRVRVHVLCARIPVLMSPRPRVRPFVLWVVCDHTPCRKWRVLESDSDKKRNASSVRGKYFCGERKQPNKEVSTQQERRMHAWVDGMDGWMDDGWMDR